LNTKRYTPRARRTRRTSRLAAHAIATVTLLAVAFLTSCEQATANPTGGSGGSPSGPSAGDPCIGPSTALFLESGGLLVVEAESAEIYGDWDVATATADYTGSAYIQWEGSDHFGKPGNGLLTYKLQIATTGTYQFRWRSRINHGTSNTEANDAWLRFADADDFYGRKNDSYVYPGGSGKAPNPKGQSKEGWFKIYQNTNGAWSWAARTSDHDGHNVYVQFDSPGTYTMEISGRSHGFGIDRIVLAHESVKSKDATDESAPESPAFCD